MDGDRALSNASASDVAGGIMRRFNEAFLTHDPSLLPPLVAEDCVRGVNLMRGARRPDRVGDGLCEGEMTVEKIDLHGFARPLP